MNARNNQFKSTNRLLPSVLLTAPLVLLGCATPYQEPTGKAVASIEFVDDAPGPMSVHLHGDSKECTDRVNPGLVQPKSSRKLKVQAGQSLVFTTGIDAPGSLVLFAMGAVGALAGPAFIKGCSATLEFIPEEDRAYIFTMRYIDGGCGYRLVEASSPNSFSGPAVPVKFEVRKWIRAMTEAGPFCEKKL
ncbi:hypothetical protein [Variovorax sp. Root318D1]|uniref:hypothetical protein n=1 Tax=Variovorax sp. Root318D1 TaxID=1736513 RepID=UPI0012FC64D9|nr:hypothetical protein [Variovorax sp. Root318D1]